jgi:hypothetical protein
MAQETLVKLPTRPNSRIDELLPDIADRVAAHSAQWITPSGFQEMH